MLHTLFTYVIFRIYHSDVMSLNYLFKAAFYIMMKFMAITYLSFHVINFGLKYKPCIFLVRFIPPEVIG